MNQLLSSTAPAPAATPDLVKDSSTERFMIDVIEASNTVPIVVDFWAPWCGPCKQLGPTLEKAVREAKGAVRLVKIDIDKNQELAAQMRIQSIPAVYAFHHGRPVDGFVGAQPESQIKAFVGRLTKAAGGGAVAGPSPIDLALEQAEAAVAAGDAGTASAIFGQVLQHEPDNAAAIAGLTRCYLAAGDTGRARQTLERTSAERVGDKAIAAARAALELAEQAAGTADATPELRQRLERNGNDHAARFDLAMALYGAGQRDGAVDELLELMRRDRAWNDGAARKQLVKLFEAFGPADPLTVSARRRLSSLLFA